VLEPPCIDLADRLAQPNAGGFITGTETLKLRENCFRLSTGSKQWDAIMLGGFQSKSVSEVFGEFRCRKTQLAHTLAVVAQLPKEQGGGEGKVAWIGAPVIVLGDDQHADAFPQTLKEPSVPNASSRLRNASRSIQSKRTRTSFSCAPIIASFKLRLSGI
jgi:hypothetical protein